MNSELNRKIKYLITAILTICLSASVISGCGKKEEKTDVVLTTAFEDNELFRIDD